jgi:hypothetical protein
MMGRELKSSKKYNDHWAMVMHPRDAVAGSDLMEMVHWSVTEVLPDDVDTKTGAEYKSIMEYGV